MSGGLGDQKSRNFCVFPTRWLRTVRKLILLSGLIEVDFDESHAQLDP